MNKTIKKSDKLAIYSECFNIISNMQRIQRDFCIEPIKDETDIKAIELYLDAVKISVHEIEQKVKLTTNKTI